MFKVSSVVTNTAKQSLSPLADYSVSDTLVKAKPFLKQSFFQRINVTDPAAVHSLLQNTPNRSRQLMETVNQVFIENSAIIYLAPYPFSALRPLIKILPFSDKTVSIFLS